MDNALAIRAMRRLELGRVGELLEVVFVRAVPNVYLGLEILETFFALLPASRMLLDVMRTAQRIAAVIAVAGITRVRKEDVICFVVADPIAATRRAR